MNHGLSQMINFDEETQLFNEEFISADGAIIDTENEPEGGGENQDNKLFTESFCQEQRGIMQSVGNKIQVN